LLAVFVNDANLANADLIVYTERSSYELSPIRKNGAAEAAPLQPSLPAARAVKTGSPAGIR
jgi:hypothetical protein